MVPWTVSAPPHIASGGVGRRQNLDAFGQAKVHDLGVTLRREHDVGGFQVAVQKPAGMRFLERLGNLHGHAKGVEQRHSAFEQSLMQRRSRDVLHHQKQCIAVLAKLEEFADIRVVERRDGHRLAAQAFARVAVGGQRGRQKLDSDETLEPRVSGAVHLAHSPSPRAETMSYGQAVRRE